MASHKSNRNHPTNHCRHHHSHRSCTWKPRGREPGYKDKFVDAVLAHDRRQLRMCLTKDRYGSWNAAFHAMEPCEQKRGKELKVYSCPYCGGFHLATRRFGGEHVGGFSNVLRLGEAPRPAGLLPSAPDNPDEPRVA